MKRIVVLSFLYCSIAFAEQEMVGNVLPESVQQIELAQTESQKEMIENDLGDLFEEEHTPLDNMHEVEDIEEKKAGVLAMVRVVYNLAAQWILGSN